MHNKLTIVVIQIINSVLMVINTIRLHSFIRSICNYLTIKLLLLSKNVIGFTFEPTKTRLAT